MKALLTKVSIKPLKWVGHLSHLTLTAQSFLTYKQLIFATQLSCFVSTSRNLVISGSSAGAIASLEADWLFCNGRSNEAFPEGFDFAGVMPFSGAIITMEGKPSYQKEPAPTAFFHGTADKVVNYKKIRLFGWGIFGSDALVRIFKKNGYTYNIFRYEGHGHARHIPLCEERALSVSVARSAYDVAVG